MRPCMITRVTESYYLIGDWDRLVQDCRYLPHPTGRGLLLREVPSNQRKPIVQDEDDRHTILRLERESMETQMK